MKMKSKIDCILVIIERHRWGGGEIIIKMDAKVTTMLIKCRVTNVTVRENVSVTML